MVDTFYRNLRQPDGVMVDLSVADGFIENINLAGQLAPASAEIVDGAGQLVLPAFVDSHLHIEALRCNHSGRHDVLRRVIETIES